MLDVGFLGLILRLVAGVVIGFCIGLTGVGGGVLVIPALTLLFGLPASTSVGTASLYSFLTKIAATVHHYRLKTVNTRIAMWFLSGAIPANIAISMLVTRTVQRLGSGSDAIADFQHKLKLLIAYVILFSCVVLAINMVKGLRKNGQSDALTGIAAFISARKIVERIACIILGAIVGALIGATSVGGGVIIIPMLIFFFGLPSSRTVGTSILIAVVLTLVTSAVYLLGGEMDLVTSVSMAVGSMLGVPLGSKLSVKLPESVLKVIVVVVITIAAVLMLTGSSSH